ncbi:rhamnogalacturonyl hydrolase YesR [Sphingomonas insulae]|uniref:Rhamnogalacturonyl hydrolase YesR n=1 Tax=Sphingomonas insulae TaxID=424800 RepID=A0ABN1HNG5_9SPHN|nr:glycoside hydrolase family 88 protein [Sphingomonas insulae]NIJ30915.1 rhamnogalacturonyl hydrolase YesR [Sphingomonas insulae]
MRSIKRLTMAAAGAATVAFALPAGVAAQGAPTFGMEPAWQVVPARPNLVFAPDRIPDRAAVLRAADYVAAAQIADMARHPLPLSTGGALDSAASNWVAATFYVGAARLARVSSQPETLRFLTATAEHYNYAMRGARSGKTMLNADDIAIGDLYQELYARRRQDGVLMPLQQRLDYSIPHLMRTEETPALVWWWCDALFMAPPVMARMSAITGDPKYLIAMDREWRRTAGLLWDKQQRLFFRDARFLDRTSANGAPVFWSRGNGWVLAGLARTIEAMPADFAGRNYYLDLFRQLAARTAELQGRDGLWRASLLDPAAFPEPETSGSGLLLYGIAWGVNHGLLPRNRYVPAVTRGWAALNRHVLPSGLLGAVQKTGDQPVATAATDVGLYGTGAYLLTAMEVADLARGAAALPVPQPQADSEQVIASTTPQPPAPRTVTGDAERARRAAEMTATAALAYDPAVLGRPATIEPLTPPTGDAARPRAIVHYAPERLDDILWENDKVALRIYGPALEAKEPPSGSGIDVWGKRVRWPFMQRQLRFPNYHVDRGEGLDFYDVGGSRGAGALGIWYGNKLWTSRNWATHRVLDTGGKVARFEVTYKPWPVDVVRRVWETRSFALPMGSHFTRMVSTLGSDDSKQPLVVGIGIGKRKTAAGTGRVVRDQANGRLTFHEPADPGHGAVSITVAADPATVVGFAQDADNYLMLVRVQPGTPFAYYTGYGWDRGLDVRSAADWDALVAGTRFDFDAGR